MMDEESVLQIVDELLSSLEPLDTHSAALMQFLKAKGITNDKELAPFIEQAANSSSVRWLAARVRIKSLISRAIKAEEPNGADAPTEQQQTSKAESAPNLDQPSPKEDQPSPKQDAPKPAPTVAPTSEKNETKEGQIAPSTPDTREDAA